MVPTEEAKMTRGMLFTASGILVLERVFAMT
jgi:hypothetical protein